MVVRRDALGVSAVDHPVEQVGEVQRVDLERVLRGNCTPNQASGRARKRDQRDGKMSERRVRRNQRARRCAGRRAGRAGSGRGRGGIGDGGSWGGDGVGEGVGIATSPVRVHDPTPPQMPHVRPEAYGSCQGRGMTAVWRPRVARRQSHVSAEGRRFIGKRRKRRPPDAHPTATSRREHGQNTAAEAPRTISCLRTMGRPGEEPHSTLPDQILEPFIATFRLPSLSMLPEPAAPALLFIRIVSVSKKTKADPTIPIVG